MNRRDVDLDEEHTKLLTYEYEREAAAERALVIGAVLADLDRISVQPDGSFARTRGTPVSIRGHAFDPDAEDLESVSTELMMRQACYRAAAAAVANPIAASLAAFLA